MQLSVSVWVRVEHLIWHKYMYIWESPYLTGTDTLTHNYQEKIHKMEYKK